MLTLRLAAYVFPWLILLDLIWVGGIAQDFYRSQIGPLLAENTLWPPALLFYVLYSFALSYFAIRPAFEISSFRHAVFRGGFIGLVAYAGYDLVNLSSLAGWSIPLSFVDILYGMTISAVVSGISFLFATRFIEHELQFSRAAGN